MRLRNLWTTLVALAVGSTLGACGGSSSETPEPVRPDAWQLRLRQKTAPESTTERPAEDPTSTASRGDSLPAKSTWGKSSSTDAPIGAPGELPLK